MHTGIYQYQNLTKNIIACFYEVYNNLGYGFLEKIYERAMIKELKKANLHGIQQSPINVYYDGDKIGNYFADILVEDKIILELKSQEFLRFEHEAQLINYLKATNYEVGLLLNFGKQPEIKRKIFSNHLKNQR